MRSFGHLPKSNFPDHLRQNSARCRNTRKTSFVHATATALQVRTGQNAEHAGPANQRREHSARSNVTNNTSLDQATATVLQVHTGHDAGHLRPLSTTSAATKRGGTRRPPLPSLLPLPPPRQGRGADELTKPGPLRRRPELDRDSEQDLDLLLPLSSRRGWPRLGEQFRQEITVGTSTIITVTQTRKRVLESYAWWWLWWCGHGCMTSVVVDKRQR